MATQGSDAGHPSDGRHHHGNGRIEFRGQQLRTGAQLAEPLCGRTRNLSDVRRVESDLHDLRAVTARRREPDGELEHDRWVMPSLAPKKTPGFRPAFSFPPRL